MEVGQFKTTEFGMIKESTVLLFLQQVSQPNLTCLIRERSLELIINSRFNLVIQMVIPL